MSEQLVQYAIKQELLDLLSLRATGADRYDPDLMRACHPADGTDNHGTYQGLMHGFIASLAQAQKLGPPCLSKEHVIGNALYEFRGDDVFVESYHVAHERFIEAGRGVDYRIGGRYLDTFRCRDGRWLIQHRDIVYDWSRVSAVPDASGDVRDEPAHLTGTRDLHDPRYKFGRVQRGVLPERPVPLTPSAEKPLEAMQRLLDKQSIAEVLYRRARAGDRADAELAHSCYHPGATERHGRFDGLATEFIDVVSFTRPKPGSPVKGMFHLITNILIDFADADHAFAESYHVAWVQMADGNDASIGGRYFDRFERRDDRWAIVHRDVIFDWSRVEPETAKFWDKHPAKPFLFGRRGAEDPLYNYVARGR
jgi:hypothetical protein